LGNKSIVELPQSPLQRSSEAQITLGLLRAVEEDGDSSQRSLARRLGIALGLTNAYLKRCVRKGYIKVRMAPANRYAYYLTPKGFAEKGRLTAEYLTVSFNFFRAARAQCDEVFSDFARVGWSRVALAGASDLAEIATLSAREHGIRLVGVVEAEADAPPIPGLPVLRRFQDIGPVDAIMVTDVREAQATYEAACRVLSPDRVRAPRLLGIGGLRPVRASLGQAGARSAAP
jgi:DNA-binding MarR family transcriptional regulator